MIMPLSTKSYNVWTLGACVRAISETSFSVKSFSDKLCSGCIDFKFPNTWATSQVSVYLGFGGLRLKTPFMNLITSGWFPALQPSTTIPREEKTPLAVLTHSYPTFLWKVLVKKLIIISTVGLRGLKCLLSRNCVHLLMWGLYYLAVPGFQ